MAKKNGNTMKPKGTEKKLTAIDKVAAAIAGEGGVLIRTAPLRLLADAVLELAKKK